MYAARPRPPIRRPIAYGQPIPPRGDFDWKFRWPFIISMIIGVILIIFSLTIFGLEIASLVKSTNKIYGNTTATGAGIWCGFFIFLAGVFILIIKFMSNTRTGAKIAFILTIIAACFSIVLIGLDAKAVKDGVSVGNAIKSLTGSYYFAPKYKILAAELAFACASFLLCLAFIIIYIVVLITSRVGRRRQQIPMRPPLR